LDLQLLKKALGDLNEELVLELLDVFVRANPGEKEVEQAVEICQQGMSIVGDQFEKGTYFIGDLIFGGELMERAMDVLKPLLAASTKGSIGKIVLGTVKGDVHNIGKNIFKTIAEAVGFEVYDIGIDQPAQAFVEKVREVKPGIVGMSALLTLGFPAMRDTVEALKAAGLRENIKIIAGGNPVTQEFCDMAGIDACGGSAVNGVKVCLRWVNK
jgi:dimethylamine corrinoid protein